jgi:hypothetical protein
MIPRALVMSLTVLSESTAQCDTSSDRAPAADDPLTLARHRQETLANQVARSENRLASKGGDRFGAIQAVRGDVQVVINIRGGGRHLLARGTGE